MDLCLQDSLKLRVVNFGAGVCQLTLIRSGVSGKGKIEDPVSDGGTPLGTCHALGVLELPSIFDFEYLVVLKLFWGCGHGKAATNCWRTGGLWNSHFKGGGR